MEEKASLERPIEVRSRESQARELSAGVIEACRRGEREAFRELFEVYKDRVYSIARNFAPDDMAAHDVTQEVFLKLFTAIRGYRGDSEFRTWLFRVVVNACADERRRSRRLVPIEHAPVVLHLTHGDVARQVRGALAGLSPRLRIPILLRHVEGMSYAEIAEVLRCSAGTVASRLNRGRRDLARRLSHLKETV